MMDITLTHNEVRYSMWLCRKRTGKDYLQVRQLQFIGMQDGSHVLLPYVRVSCYIKLVLKA